MIVEQKFGNGFTWINIEAEQLRTETSEIQANIWIVRLLHMLWMIMNEPLWNVLILKEKKS